MGIVATVVGIGIVVTVINALIKALLSANEMINGEVVDSTWFQMIEAGSENVQQIIETIFEFPAKIIVVMASNIYNLIPNMSVTIIIMLFIIIIIAFKFFSMIKNGG